MIDKGNISSILDGGAKATVIPSAAQSNVTIPLVVPKFLIGSLSVGMDVVYVSFEDNTGIILSRLDGDWSHKFDDDIECKKITATDVVASGDVTATDVTASGDVVASGKSLASHVHSYTWTSDSGSDVTGVPQ